LNKGPLNNCLIILKMKELNNFYTPFLMLTRK
jgi:hypothetical protein